MIYKITFFRFQITTDDWKQFYETIFSVAWGVKITIIRVGRKIDFYIESSKKLDALNSHLSPFYLSSDLTSQEQTILQSEPTATMRVVPFIFTDPFLHMLEKFSVKEKEILRISFSLHKYDLVKFMPIYTVWYAKNGAVWKTTAYSPLHNPVFLDFDVSNTIQAEITKIKPVLAANSMHFQGFPEGILDLPEFQKTAQFSVSSYDFWRHSLVIGQSGSGKSFLLKLLIDDIAKKTNDDYAIVLVDPHASLEQLVKIKRPSKSINFKTIGTDLFVNVGQPLLSTELTIDLFSTILNVHENQNMERVLKYALQALYTMNKMDVLTLRTLLTDAVERKQILKDLTDTNILKFFETEYQTLATSQYQTAVLPIINLLSELDFINSVTNKVNFVKELQNNFLLSFPIKQTDLGKNITKIIGGAIIQQVFTIMQAGLVKKKVILIVDEVSVVQSPSLIHILSEARKFGLTVILTQQYLMQVSAGVLQSILANTVNYFIFKLSREDAEIAARNVTCNIDEYFLEKKNDPKESLELSIKLMTDLNPREVIGRVLANDRYSDAFKAKTVQAGI